MTQLKKQSKLDCLHSYHHSQPSSENLPGGRYLFAALAAKWLNTDLKRCDENALILLLHVSVWLSVNLPLWQHPRIG